jgi:hypothetical protein
MSHSYACVVPLLVLGLLGAVPGAAWAQVASPPGAPSSQAQTATPPAGQVGEVQKPAEPTAQADLDRVKEALQAPPTVRFDPHILDAEVRFYAIAHGKSVTFEDLVGTFDLMNGPVLYANMTHEEFMAMSQPPALSRHITFGDVTKFAALQLGFEAAEKLILKGIEAIRNAKSEHEVQAIRAQIDKELAALSGQTIIK